MGEGFAAKTAEVSQVAELCAAIAEELTAGLASCSADVNILLMNWRGSAASSFESAFDEFTRATGLILAALKDESGDLQRAAVAYVDSDESSASALITAGRAG
ncbi:WXG100 family type VII secretion target [Jatrophihabitans sp. GAS493]|uniref:WXG100 family type VII secretion target n=1 Tax=Jatrophihabitans sp. GAS493 TaxID=1907575 RepID=UPI000BB78FFB|nr:WXG100 family type VII secretion target [Jatrophihabitans sp. GAS493]SOD72769.1 WXG100 family type VII secretion target [Jatrophihabitans sp. GAS493]